MISIFNSTTDYKGFVATNCEKIRKNNEKGIQQLRFWMRPRKNSQGICPHCGRPCPTYDTSRVERFFDFPMLWGIPVFLVYFMRRVSCPEHGVVTEKVPWAEGKETQTKEQVHFLATWARRMDWSSVAKYFHTTYGKVARAVRQIVEYGLKHRSLEDIESIGVDEIQYRSGHKYLTLIYQIDDSNKRLLWIGKDRTEQTMERFFDEFNKEPADDVPRSEKIQWVCSDMWKPYLKTIKEHCGNALNILDRFHIKKHLNEAVDQTRKEEIRRLRSEGKETVLTGSKWLLLKNSENLSETQAPKLKELLGYNLRCVRAYLLKESFDRFWTYKSAYWAERYLDNWCTQALKSRITPLKKFVKMIRTHKELIMNWFASKRLSSGVVEGFNNKVKLTVRKSYGFGSDETLQTALFHTLGKLPEPELTHRFC